MPRSGRITIVLVAMLLARFEPWPCRAQPPALLPPASTPAPGDRRDPGPGVAAPARPPATPASSHPVGRRVLIASSRPAGLLAAPAPNRPPEGDGDVLRLPAPSESPLRMPILLVPPLEDLVHAATLEAPHRRLPIDVAAAFQVGTEPAARLSPAAAAMAPPGGDLSLRLKPAPLEPTDLRFPINLATALRLADARPLIIAAAQASVWVAEAQLTRAKVLWIPTLNVGFDYYRHDGGGPDINKGIMTFQSFNFFYGGAGLTQFVAVTDAIFQPLAARQVLNARQWDIQTAKNDALLQTANAYINVHLYRGMYASSLYVVERGRDLVERIAQLSRELVPAVEVDRARNMLADMEQQSVLAHQRWRTASADLTQVLRLDPRAVVVPLESDHLQLTLIDPDQPLPDLQRIALSNRPELAARRALIQAAELRVRQEKMRPFLPTFTLNGIQTPFFALQAGMFALGTNVNLNQWQGRFDLSPQLVWQLEGFGVGNLARIKAQRGLESQAVIDFYRTQDQVAAEVFQAQTRLQSAALRVEQADRAVRTAITTFNGTFEGFRHTVRFENILYFVYRPFEAVYALELMKLAFDEYFTTVADYNRAQFELFHALGYPAQEITYLRPPGNIVPVDTTRPAYLPPVGHGPPPATR